MTTRRTLLHGIAASILALAAGGAHAAWPERPITLIVPWGAGGGTDATARIIGTLLEKELGQPVNVVNRTGGSGVVGHQAIAAARARRLHDRPHHGRDRHDALAGPHRPDRRVVHADRRWSTPTRPGCRCAPTRRTRPSNDLVAAIKANPGKFKASGTGQGGIWHLAIAGMLKDLKVDPAARAVGAVERRRARACRTSSPAASRSCPCSLPEARSLIDAGKVQEPGGHGRHAGRALSRTCRR